MPIRITGLNSGLDTEAIISALVSSYNYKTQKYKKAQTKLSWKQDAWKDLNTKIYSLYTSVGNLRFSNTYNMKNCTISDSTKVSVSAGSGSVNGSYSVQVTQLAKAGYLTGGQLKKADGTSVTSSTTLAELGYTGGSGKMSVKIGGKTTDISVTENSTIQEVVNQLKDAGVNASFDEKNRRIFVSAKDTGVENDFSLTGADGNGTNALNALGLNVASDANVAEYKELVDKYSNISLADMKTIVANKVAATNENKSLKTINNYYADAVSYAKAVEGIKTVGTGDEVELLKTLVSSTSLEDKYVDSAGNVYEKDKESGLYISIDKDGVKKEVSEEDIKNPDNEYIVASDKLQSLKETYFGKEDDEGNIQIDEDAVNAFKTNLSTVKSIAEKATTASTLEVTLGDETLSVGLQDLLDKVETGTITAEDFETECNAMVEKVAAEIGVNNTTLAEHSRLTTDMMKEVVDEETGAVTADYSAVDAFYAKVDYAKSSLKTGQDGKPYIDGEYSSGATRVNGSDSIIYVNGARYDGDSNTFSINGMTITATGVTTTEADMQAALASGTEPIGAVNVTVNTDVQGIYDKVKDFLTQYNSLINEMTSLYNAASAKGYEPLSDEERDAMSDTEIEKWEEKIKASLLRRDDTLSGLISSMTNAMAKGVNIGGKTYYLSTFGIKTLGYMNAPKNEHNAYHIDGDEDDVNTSGNADKLMAAIAEDPDSVMEFMQNMAKNLYDAVDSRMKSTSLSSTYTVYNDKEMASEYSDYTSLINKWQERLEQQEERYYKQFSAMETALSKINSQTSSLSGFFG